MPVETKPSSAPKTPRQATVKLPPARVEQLKALQKALGMKSVADTVGYLIGKEIAAGVIEQRIPGVSLHREGKMTLLSLNDHPPVYLSPKEAAQIAKLIRMRAEGSELRQMLMSYGDSYWTDLGVAPVRIERQGKGVNIRVRDEMMSFSPALALELADLIQKSAVH